MTVDTRIEQMLLDANEGFISRDDLLKCSGSKFHQTVVNAISRLRRIKYGIRLIKQSIGRNQQARYAILNEACAAKTKILGFHLPKNLWRGWQAPGAKTRPSHLGV